MGTRGPGRDMTGAALPVLAGAALVAVVVGLVVCSTVHTSPTAPTNEAGDMIRLPQPDRQGHVPLETAMTARRSRRDFAHEAIELADLGQLLWAAQGCTTDRCLRTAPSAGATYPLEVYVLTGKGGVVGMDAGVWLYHPRDHALSPHASGDARAGLASAALGQSFIAAAPATLVIAAVRARTAKVYGDRAERYVDMEVGHAGQNVYLQCEALGLSTVAVGAFDDAAVSKVLGLPSEQIPLYIMPVGRPSGG